MLFWHSRPKPKRIREHFDLMLEALGIIIQNQEAIMAGQDRFNTALADLSTKLDAHDVAVQKAIVDLKAAFAKNDDAAFNTAADALSALSSKLAAETADLASADQPLPSPAPDQPAPAPAPAPAEPAPAPTEPAAPAVT